MPWLTGKCATRWFEAIVMLADLVAGEYSLDGVSDDPDDDKYIAAFVEGRASFVVTGDPHLLAIAEYADTRIVSPRQFLNALVG